MCLSRGDAVPDGEPADAFFLIRARARSRSRLVGRRRGPIVIETLHDGEIARLLVARSSRTAGCSTAAPCDDTQRDRVRRRLPARQVRRRSRARLRADAAASPRSPSPASRPRASSSSTSMASHRGCTGARWCPARVPGRRRGGETADTWTLELEPGDCAVRARASSRCSYAVRRGRGADLDQRRPATAGASSTPSARSAPRRGRSARPSRARRSACAARSACRGRSAEIEGADVVIVAGGIGLAPLRPGDPARCSRDRERYGRVTRPPRRAHARPAALPRASSSSGAARSSVEVTVDSAAPRVARARRGRARS